MPFVTPLPTPPNRATDTPTQFADKGDALLGALPVFVDELNELEENLNSSNSAANYSATSTTSVAIGTGSKSFTVETGKRYVAGTFITIADAAAPTTNFMYGQVTSYNSLTGALVFDSQRVGGSGTKTAWLLSLSGPQGIGGDTLPSFGGNGGYILQLNSGATAPLWIPHVSFIRLAADYTLASTTASQKLFNTTTNGAVTLPVGRYSFEFGLKVEPPGGAAFATDVKGAGTATLHANTLFYVHQAVVNTWTPTLTQNTTTAAAPGMTGSVLTFFGRGVFSVTVAGTLIPSIALTSAVAAVVKAGSYFRCDYIGSADSVGVWS